MNRYGRTLSSSLSHHGVKTTLTFLCVFPSHEHGCTRCLLGARHFLTTLGQHTKSTVPLLEEFDGSASKHTRNSRVNNNIEL